jgi:hypothetical protein
LEFGFEQTTKKASFEAFTDQQEVAIRKLQQGFAIIGTK